MGSYPFCNTHHPLSIICYCIALGCLAKDVILWDICHMSPPVFCILIPENTYTTNILLDNFAYYLNALHWLVIQSVKFKSKWRLHYLRERDSEKWTHLLLVIQQLYIHFITIVFNQQNLSALTLTMCEKKVESAN